MSRVMRSAPYESLDLFGTLIVGEYRLGSLHAQETTPMNYQAELNKFANRSEADR
jgi:hypothetical protein